MYAATHQRRLTRLAILMVTGATAVSLAACSSSSNENAGKPSTSESPTSLPPKPPPAPPMGHDEVEGLVRSVSGNTIQLTQRDRTAAAVDFTPSTMVTELGPAKLTDVTPGSCVYVATAAPGGPPGGPVTAQSVTISPSEAGKCPPAAAPSPGVNGTVDSVTGNTIAVNSTDPTGKTTHTTVNVTDTTTYNQHAVTNAQAIQNGKCMAAQGIKDGAVLHAATIDLEPCPAMGRPHHHFRIPHLPHLRHH
jgi:hypothetical protein